MEEVEAKKLAEQEIKSSQERLEAAEILLKNGKIVDSISRAYYAMFHAARALLYLYGVEPRTHEGVIREFSRIITEEKLMDKKFGRNLRQVFETRESGDYRVGVIFEEEDAKDVLEKAKEFVMQIKKISEKIIKEKF
jgi:uncharacterized protein (UPF0332 family)